MDDLTLNKVHSIHKFPTLIAYCCKWSEEHHYFKDFRVQSFPQFIPEQPKFMMMKFINLPRGVQAFRQTHPRQPIMQKFLQNLCLFHLQRLSKV